MFRRARIVTLLVCSAVWAGGGVASGQEPTFTGLFADGAYVTGGRISEWHDTAAQPKLNGQLLFDPARPIRWLRSELPDVQVAPTAFVEMIGGDRLPGRVLEYHGGGSSFEQQADHLAVKVDVPVDMPDEPPRAVVRVKLPALRRIVWQRRTSDQYVPGTLFYRDGRQLSFRAVRWSPTAVSVLLPEGTRRVPFDDIAELHLPARNAWDAYYESLALVGADCTVRLMRIETFAGLVATTSYSRFRARAVSGDPGGWFHLLAPAWSLDPLWVRHVHVQWRRIFLPTEVPLAQIEPTKIVQRASLGGGWKLHIDRSVRGELLRSGGRTFGWGFGTQAFAALAFDLPNAVKQLQTRVGLDEAAGRGGCARGMIYINRAEGEPVFKTPHLIGSGEPVTSGPIALAGPAAGQQSILLVSDPAHADRPPGADPLDIRDLVDWLEPVLTLDLDKLQAEIAARLPRALVAWEGWQPVLPAGGKLQLLSYWDAANPRAAGYRLHCVSTGGPLTLERRARLAADDHYLLLAVSRTADATTPTQIQVRIDGDPLVEFDVPERRPGVPLEPRLVSLDAYRGREVRIEIVQTPQSDKSWVEWRALELVAYPTPTPWIPLVSREATASGETTLRRLADDSLLAAGKPADAETYTVVADTELLGISALRLEALSDPRSPALGPGRAPDGSFTISNVRVTAAPRGRPDLAQPVALSLAAADFSNPEAPVAGAIDADPNTGWKTSAEPGRDHLAVFTAQHDVGFAGGTTLSVALDQRAGPGQSLGRFRLSVTNVPRPVPAERPGKLLPAGWVGRAVALFEDQPETIVQLAAGGGQAALDFDDKFSGASAIRLVGDRNAPQLPRLGVKIRQNPAAGEYRFLQFAWKKVDGQAICLDLCHDGLWGPAATVKFRYHAGPGPEPRGASLLVDAALPTGWKLVTRDLFQDFGEFTLTGLGLGSIDGQYALFDRILLARELTDFETAKAFLP